MFGLYFCKYSLFYLSKDLDYIRVMIIGQYKGKSPDLLVGALVL